MPLQEVSYTPQVLQWLRLAWVHFSSHGLHVLAHAIPLVWNAVPVFTTLIEIYTLLCLSVKLVANFYSVDEECKGTLLNWIWLSSIMRNMCAYLLVLSEWLSITSVNISNVNISCDIIGIVLGSSANQNLFAEPYWVNISYHNICQYHRFYKSVIVTIVFY